MLSGISMQSTSLGTAPRIVTQTQADEHVHVSDADPDLYFRDHLRLNQVLPFYPLKFALRCMCMCVHACVHVRVHVHIHVFGYYWCDICSEFQQPPNHRIIIHLNIWLRWAKMKLVQWLTTGEPGRQLRQKCCRRGLKTHLLCPHKLRNEKNQDRTERLKGKPL